ncbi:carbon-nitrogen hydrolase family protein [Methylicorpusculum sp.]|uniref:carbon-nitrogen hydrolase family protein n=1 Tax=Methylicorpusculum sp. TaxID=2713644 RepID=UPI00272FC3A0|nr:carbon-nitrogen hydrolase family protein [Methylicorpusculum sp.]MDP2177781.1 carbon-nitrogen hydrolase family protein [Methylicorpusculum sp.]MDP3530880.1 carbon-nitrogen hydrolase family protein [Methylicorpusculum sp.]MDZ4150574.1 carbon-nitrogen hydrolase family protein [Methylicorpusculum sp.]
MTVKIATAQYDISFLKSWSDYEQKINQWVQQAVEENARILLFPEYGSLELASLFPKEIYSSLEKQLSELQTLHERFVNLYQQLASQHNCYIQAGTFPVKLESGEYRNRAYLFMRDGSYDFQDKLQMTRFENEQWLIKSGTELKCFDTDFGKIAINVCYDSEFPLLARKQIEAGANLILVPSCTDTLAGYHRVKIGCQARALENQCYVVQSPTVGVASWSEAVDINIGAAAVYTPVDRGFPDNGIAAMGELNKTQWVFADLYLENIAKVREEGQVFNYRDWPLQSRFINPL